MLFNMKPNDDILARVFLISFNWKN